MKCSANYRDHFIIGCCNLSGAQHFRDRFTRILIYEILYLLQGPFHLENLGKKKYLKLIILSMNVSKKKIKLKIKDQYLIGQNNNLKLKVKTSLSKYKNKIKMNYNTEYFFY